MRIDFHRLDGLAPKGIHRVLAQRAKAAVLEQVEAINRSAVFPSHGDPSQRATVQDVEIVGYSTHMFGLWPSEVRELDQLAALPSQDTIPPTLHREFQSTLGAAYQKVLTQPIAKVLAHDTRSMTAEYAAAQFKILKKWAPKLWPAIWEEFVEDSSDEVVKAVEKRMKQRRSKP